jgi:hypothetical protein
MEPARTTARCPHCGETIDWRIEVRVTVAPPTRLHFQDADELDAWLHASRLSLKEFQRLPVYGWQQAELQPLVDELVARDTAISRASARYCPRHAQVIRRARSDDPGPCDRGWLRR